MSGIGARRPRSRAEGLAALQQELLGEMAASLGRAGQKLERAIAELEQIAAEARALTGGARAERVRAHRALRAIALEYRWCLEVQREAIGLRDHRALDRFYRVPPPLRG
jgi:hypothetical protein